MLTRVRFGYRSYLQSMAVVFQGKTKGMCFPSAPTVLMAIGFCFVEITRVKKESKILQRFERNKFSEEEDAQRESEIFRERE